MSRPVAIASCPPAIVSRLSDDLELVLARTGFSSGPVSSSPMGWAVPRWPSLDELAWDDCKLSSCNRELSFRQFGACGGGWPTSTPSWKQSRGSSPSLPARSSGFSFYWAWPSPSGWQPDRGRSFCFRCTSCRGQPGYPPRLLKTLESQCALKTSTAIICNMAVLC